MKENSNITQELLERIERYYNDSMTMEERNEFEAKLHQDATFKSQVEDIKTLLFGIEKQSLKEKMEVFHKEMPIQMELKPSSTKVRFLQFRNIAAAAIIIIGSVSFWFFNGSSNERLYNSYFSPDPGLPTTMSSSDNFAFYDAMVNYKQGEYHTAIDKWEALRHKEPKNDTLNYFLGVAHLADDNTDKAILFLNETASTQKSVFNEDANYYLGLAYLKKDDRENALKFLKLSTSENSKLLIDKLK